MFHGKNNVDNEIYPPIRAATPLPVAADFRPWCDRLRVFIAADRSLCVSLVSEVAAQAKSINTIASGTPELAEVDPRNLTT